MDTLDGMPKRSLRSLKFWWRLTSARQIIVMKRGQLFILSGFGPTGHALLWHRGGTELLKEVDGDEELYRLIDTIQ